MARELKSYNHLKATLAIAKASLRSIMRSPSAVVFTLAFPLIFILVFGFIGGNGLRINIAVDPQSAPNNPIVKQLAESNLIKIVDYTNPDDIQKRLEKGNIDALLKVDKQSDSLPQYVTQVQYTTASMDVGKLLKSVLNEIAYRLNASEQNQPVVEIRETTVKGRAFKTIDFILPGQLGFSLLSTGVFGTAFVFFSLRQNLVIKRFFATPVRRSSIILGEAIARIGFALCGALFIILIGHYLFDFTLVHGAATVLNLLVLAFLGVIVFMGFGFVVSGLAKSESTIPPISNIITLPQFLLSGTFFSVEAFPYWLQPISKALPLTYLNDALRKVAFEGASLWDVKMQMGIMMLWGILIYTIAVKTFKWD